MSRGRNAIDASYPNLFVSNNCTVAGKLYAKHCSSCYLHATASAQCASMVIDPLTINAVIGPTGTTVPTGSMLFDTLQTAVTYADTFTDGDVVLNVPAGDYTAEGIIATSNANSNSSLHIRGPVATFHGKSYADGQPIINTWTGSGTGVATITVIGAVVTVAGSLTAPDFVTAGVSIGDQIVVFLETGVIDGVYTITSVAATALSLNAAPTAPVTATNGYGIAFMPDIHVAGYSLASRQGDVYIENHYLPSTATSGSVITADACRVFLTDSVIHRSDLTNPDNAISLTDARIPYSEVSGSTVISNRGMGVSYAIRGRITDSVFFVPITAIGAGEALNVSHGARALLNGTVMMVGIPSNAMIFMSDSGHLIGESGHELYLVMQANLAGGLTPAMTMRNLSRATLGTTYVRRYDTYTVATSHSIHLQGSSRLHMGYLESTLNNNVPALNTGSHLYANTDSSIVLLDGIILQGLYGIHGEGLAHLTGSATIVSTVDGVDVMVGDNVADGGLANTVHTNVADTTVLLRSGVRYVL